MQVSGRGRGGGGHVRSAVPGPPFASILGWKFALTGVFPRRGLAAPRPRNSGAASLSSPAEKQRPAAPAARGRGRIRQIPPPHPPLPRLHRRRLGGVGGRLLPPPPRPPPPEGEALGPGDRHRLRRSRCLSGKDRGSLLRPRSPGCPAVPGGTRLVLGGEGVGLFPMLPSPPRAPLHSCSRGFTVAAFYCWVLILAILVVVVNSCLIRNIKKEEGKKSPCYWDSLENNINIHKLSPLPLLITKNL